MRYLAQTWPLPAVLAWGLAWGVFGALGHWGIATGLAALVACTVGVGASVLGGSWWRRVLIALGFPLSLGLSGAAPFAGGYWLLPLAVLLLVYPYRAWKDAPLFPTPPGALDDLPGHAPLQAGAAILDAGCGVGDGLRALRRAYPQARLHGIEYSWPLRLACALRCPGATVRHGDFWAADWSPYAMVYLFQRPETMHRALEKAQKDLLPGAYLVSLEFEATGWMPHATLRLPDGRPVWVYRAPVRLA
ncbi:class I SAM-dependent methyltransferase [Candidatus Symbiobacter mobilis]|uniref:Methyltransferase type 12 n=1 Tax=Candidatus Symbiobacter mobilis CR TaxID=946483 RepID=U5NAA2_9BURK|nr:class I SAM-dependent methyltransferase [Candidatus Symbiobacter mobilis]AGX88250.1 methyltransferase type 12 [Candidatus Symbiobacter mobilis CR]